MNDSFLEDLELLPQDIKQSVSHKADRHVTTRHPSTSSPLFRLTEEDELQSLIKQTKSTASSATVQPIHSTRDIKDLIGKELRKSAEREIKKHATKVRSAEKKEKVAENKHKLQEYKQKIKSKERRSVDETKTAQLGTAQKYVEKGHSKSVTRRSDGHKENSHSSDASSKENSHPELSAENNLHVAKDKNTAGEAASRKLVSKDKDAVVLLSAIKDLISTYTKQESSKILRAMQELHINSQSTLIKNLLCQTEELINEMHPSKNSSRLKALIEENEKLRESIIVLQMRNNELHKKLEDFELIKQENITLKLKCKDMLKQ